MHATRAHPGAEFQGAPRQREPVADFPSAQHNVDDFQCSEFVGAETGVEPGEQERAIARRLVGQNGEQPNSVVGGEGIAGGHDGMNEP